MTARRRALVVLSVAPVWTISAAVLFSLWPWKQAAMHLAVLGLLGIILAEFSIEGVLKIPFSCSYLPGRSNFHITLLLWIFLLAALILEAADNERKALQSPGATIAVLASLGAAAAFCILRNNWLASPSRAELRFEKIPHDQLVRLDVC